MNGLFKVMSKHLNLSLDLVTSKPSHGFFFFYVSEVDLLVSSFKAPTDSLLGFLAHCSRPETAK